MQQTVEINSIATALKELAPLIEDLQQTLETGLGSGDPTAGAAQATQRLDEIRGTLQLLDLLGPSMLAGEMRKLAGALAEERAASGEAAVEALLKAVFKLPDYLDRLRAGRQDRPVVLLPLMNELRAARGAEPLEERAVFFPSLESAPAPADDDALERAELGQTARRVRLRFQRALLGWYRGHEVAGHLETLGATLQELGDAAGSAAVQRLWQVCGALTESLSDQGLEGDRNVKVLMGRVERLLSRLVHGGERTLEREIPLELLRNLLYYVARSGSDSARVRAVKDAYHLDELLPDSDARADFEGPNRALLEVVGQGVRDDIARIKDAVEIYVHSDERRPHILEGVPERMRQVADTFSMLGIEDAHERLHAEADVLAKIESLDPRDAEVRLNEVADVLLRVESDLVELQRGRPHDESAAEQPELEIRALPDSEYRPLLSAVVAAALDDLSKVREAIGVYCDDPERGQEAVAEVPALLEEVEGAGAMLALRRATPLVRELRDYVERDFVQQGSRPDEDTQMLLADVVAGLEYYLEAVDYDRAGMVHLLESATRAMAALRSGGQPESHEEDEQVVIDGDVPVAGDAQAPAVETPAGADAAPPPGGGDDLELAGLDVPAAAPSGDAGDDAGPPQGGGEDLEHSGLDVPAAATSDDAGDDADEDVYDLSGYPEELAAAPAGDDAPGAPAAGRDPAGGDAGLAGDADDGTDAGPGADTALPDLELDPGADDDAAAAPGAADEATAEGPSGDPGRMPEEDEAAASTDTAGAAELPDLELDFGVGDEEEGGSAADVDLGGEEDDTGAGFAFEVGDDDAAEAAPAGRAGPGVDPDASGSRLAILGDDADDEIVGVFIEEALGELDRINGCLPRWRAAPDDETPLQDVRRAFHTLKGGGRLIGAELVGEFSWSMENMLNRVLDHSIEPSPAVFDTLDEAATALPQLIEQIQGNRAPIDGIDDLIARAHALSRGEDGPPRPPGGEPPGGAPADGDGDVPRGGAPGDAAGDAGGDDAAATPGPADAGSGGDGPHGPRAQAGDEAAADPAPAAQADPGAATDAGADFDDTLLRVFTAEAEAHQAVLRGAFGAPGDEACTMIVDQDVRRALHTLVGSAQTADMETIARLAGRMEEIARTRREADERLTTREVELFRETIAKIDELLAALPHDTDVETDELQARLDTQRAEVVEAAGSAAGEGESELIEIFIEEGDEILDACDRAMARWRANPGDRDVIPALQRSLHTLKGGARMAGIGPIAQLTHEMESLVNAVDDGSCRLTGEVLDLLQEAVDALTVLLTQARGRQQVARVDWLVEDLRDVRVRGGGEDAAAGDAAGDVAAGGTAPAATGAEPDTGAEPTAGVEPTAGAEPAPVPEAAAAGGAAHAGPGAAAGDTAPAAPAVAQPGAEQVRVQSELLDSLVNFAGEVSIYHSRLGEQMGQYRFNLNEFEQTVRRLREQLRTMEGETESQILYRHEKEGQDRAREDFDPLELDRYTRIQELSRQLAESVGDLDSIKEILDELTRDAETLLLQQSRVSSELQDGLLQTRMVRFDGLRGRLGRVVRQTAGTLGKKAQLVMSGGEIEIDRSIQERIVAPLEHILRNAVAHAIEPPDRRRDAGKPEQGTIRLDLHRGGTDIIMEITDDGKGIDAEGVRRKGIERGYISADDEIDDSEVIKLILQPGFSTAEEITQISGRGVGMDVVDAEVRRLGGSLGIQTEMGVGTRFTVRLPVTLAINQAVLVQAGDETYAVPIASIEGVTQVTAGELRRHYIDASEPLTYAGNEYAVHHLGSLLGVAEPRLDDPEISYPVVMVRAGDDRVALHVDQLVGRREVVVKPLGAPLSTLAGISGATVMADGSVVLILDIGGLLRTDTHFVATGGLHAPEEVSEEGTGAGESAPTVLVVDDSITIRKVTQRILARNGINVATATDGVDALSWMAHTVPDLVLLDIEMPRMDGYEVATYVRGEERLSQVPIIMVTSRTGDKHRRRAEEVGVDRYLGKPYQEAELMEHINALIRTPQAA